ncbi:hypothetical protein NDU88_004507, partial [Pleurodeles waltl]
MALKRANHVRQGRQQGSLGDEVPPQSECGPQGKFNNSASRAADLMALKSANHMGQGWQQGNLRDEVRPQSE